MKEFPKVELEFSRDDQEFQKLEQEFPRLEQVDAPAIVTKTREEDCDPRKRRRGRPSLGRLRGDKRRAANMRERNRMRGLVRSVIPCINIVCSVKSISNSTFSRAYECLKELLPNNGTITSKQQIITKVNKMRIVITKLISFFILKAIERIRELETTAQISNEKIEAKESCK